MSVTDMIATALDLAATMEPARAAETAIDNAIDNGLTINYRAVRACLDILGTDHPERASLQVAASAALTTDALRKVMTDALAAARQLLAV